MIFDSEGNFWGGGDTGLWFITPEGDVTNMTMEHDLPSDQVNQITFSSDGFVWIATDGGLVKLNEEGIVDVLNADELGIENDGVRSLLAASDGSLWVSQENGLSHLTPEGDWEHFGIGNLFSENFSFVSDIVEHPNGSIWIATLGDGLYQLNDNEWEHYFPTDRGVDLPSPYVNKITVAPDGSLWFGTEEGAARFDGEQWWSWDLEDGLSHWNVNDIFVEANGTTWFATSGGITRWKP
jgi:ligand-binding sensor domain-containing protein